jgi:gp32-like DNA binding protein
MDLQAMKAKLATLAAKGKGNDTMLKLVEGENILRVVPLKGSPDSPFQEFLFHYLQSKTYLSPRSYGEVDPLADFSDALVSQGGLSKDEYKEAKKLSPQLRTYLPVVVRGHEADGVKFWGFGKTTLETILKIINDEDYGDIADVENGFDLRVTYTPKEKSDTNFAKTEVYPRRKSTPLSTDGALVEKLLNEQPVLAESFKKHTVEELTEVLAKYLNPSTATSNPQAATTATAASGAVWATDEAEKAQATPAPAKISKDVQAEFDEVFNS